MALLRCCHWHIVKTGLTLMTIASISQQYWDDAFVTTTYLINWLPSPFTHHKIPIELLFKKVSNYTFLHTFGCACWPYFHPYHSHKMDYWLTYVFFLVTAQITEVIVACRSHSVTSTSLVTWSLTNHDSHFNLPPLLPKTQPLFPQYCHPLCVFPTLPPPHTVNLIPHLNLHPYDLSSLF